jgi:hypothetical protein
LLGLNRFAIPSGECTNIVPDLIHAGEKLFLIVVELLRTKALA